MESMLGVLEEEMMANDLSSSSLNDYKLVPWLSWEEWDSVRERLFSSSTDMVVCALNKVSTWKSRGCLPVVIDVTASIVEVQQKDPYYRDNGDQPTDALHSEQLLAMLYCMAILRLVNCVVEKTRKRTEVSIAEAANAIGIPRKLIDVRHGFNIGPVLTLTCCIWKSDVCNPLCALIFGGRSGCKGSHRDLPALQVVRDCSEKALDWLKTYYWEPQKQQIPFQGDKTADIKREIKSRLHELAICLKVNQSPQLGSSPVKVKRGKYCEGLCGHNISNYVREAPFIQIWSLKGSKRKMTNCLKFLVQLYSSYSSETASVLLELLLNTLDSSNLEFANGSNVFQNINTLLDDWRSVITRFSNKEPELLLTLLKAVLDIIENEEGKKFETGGQNQTSSEYTVGTRQIEHLSYLFAWLAGLLRSTDFAAEVKVSSTGKNFRNATLVELLRKCLLVSAADNKLLMDSALHLAQLVGNTTLLEKLSKLFSNYLSNLDVFEENTSLVTSKNLLIRQEDSIREAAKKLEFVKQKRMKNKIVTMANDVGTLDRWVVAKSWNSCPIGMLPRDVGSSGRLPVLDYDENKQAGPEPSEREDMRELKHRFDKREANCNIKLLDNSIVKKMKVTPVGYESDYEDVFSAGGTAKGHLMIGGVWKKVGEQELQVIKSGVRILI
ncbi:hypothetical protein JRO89_XSUnG0205000 [Xanthoceras sorbifolium]|uniref:Las1-like family protein n=1 Tax=Xanthoceras sorbifolium TaxID=99658 RepID=A0ABQ8GX63_9ROSI|nr:hypothetical protein JRO89_XSUnG0205000 [Xanthoceras sorbifolium]